VDNLVEYYISKNVAGIVASSLAGEMFELSSEERLHVVRVCAEERGKKVTNDISFLLFKRVVKAAKGRVGVIAIGNFGATLDEQASYVKVRTVHVFVE
jgi:dihydrodipicolinate synthase/N-acetylneuraminate lyase